MRPWHASETVSLLVGLRTYKHPSTNLMERNVASDDKTPEDAEKYVSDDENDIAVKEVFNTAQTSVLCNDQERHS